MRIISTVGALILTVSSCVPDAMTTSWLQFTRNLKEKLPACHQRLNPGASTSEIEDLERTLALELPKEFKTLYALNNGEDTTEFAGGVMCGFKMLTLREVLVEWKTLRPLTDDSVFNTKFHGEIKPEGAVRSYHFNKKWVPVFSDHNGNYLGVDLDPGVNGKVGQIINFGADEYDRQAFAGSLSEFVKIINDQFLNGTIDKAIVTNRAGQRVVFGFKQESHLTDDLKGMELRPAKITN